MDQCRVACGPENEQHHAAADDRRPSALAAPPDRKRRRKQEGEQQDRGELAQPRPAADGPHGHRDVFSQERDAAQARDLDEVQVGLAEKVDEESRRPRGDGRRSEPRGARPKERAHEEDERRDENEDGNVHPPHEQAELDRVGRPHQRELDGRDGRDGEAVDGEEEIGPLPLPHTDQGMHERERQARRRDGGPDDRDPARHEASRSQAAGGRHDGGRSRARIVEMVRQSSRAMASRRERGSRAGPRPTPLDGRRAVSEAGLAVR